MGKILFIGFFLFLAGCFFSNSTSSSHNRNAVDTLRENQQTLRRGYGVYRPQHQYPQMNRQFQNQYRNKK